jgi:hypothetical protein
MPKIPARLVLASLGLAVVILFATVDLAASADVIKSVCRYCTDTM